MKIPKPTPAITERFLALLPTDAVAKPMFGCKAGFINGNMIGGTWQDTVMVRLSAADRTELEDLGGEVFDPMGGRPMTGYFLVPSSISASDDGLRTWVDRAARFTRTLPAKVKKGKGVRKRK